MLAFLHRDVTCGNMIGHISVRLEARALLEHTTLYQEFRLEHEEILKHKWIESEKAGRDIGFDAALVDWTTKYRSGWRRHRLATLAEKRRAHTGSPDDPTRGDTEISETGSNTWDARSN